MSSSLYRGQDWALELDEERIDQLALKAALDLADLLKSYLPGKVKEF